MPGRPRTPPEGKGRDRRAIGEETAETFSRAGEHRRGVEILERLLKEARGRREEGHLRARAGIIAHRSGDVDRAVFHLEREFLLQLHTDRGGSLQAMASDLGITVRALYGRFERLGIRPRDLG